MNTLVKTGRCCGRWTLRLSFILLLLTALSLCLGRYLLARLIDDPTAVQASLSTYFDAPVAFRAISVAWQGWRPRLQLEGFRLGASQDNGLSALRFDQGQVELNILKSLFARRLEVHRLRVEGLRVSAERGATDKLPFGFTAGSANLPSAAIAKLVARLAAIPALDLVFQELRLQAADGSKTPLVLRDLRITLRSHGDKRRLHVASTLPEAWGHHLQAALEWRGDLFDKAASGARFYLRGEALELSNWPLSLAYPVQITGGRAHPLEVWGDWRQGAVQALEGRVAVHDLSLPELPTMAGLNELLRQAPTLFAEFGWRRTSQGWTSLVNFSGRDADDGRRINTALAIQWQSGSGDALSQLQGYWDDIAIDDLATLVAPWLPDASQQVLAQLEPTGQATEVTFRARFGDNSEWMPQHYAVAARVHQVAIRSWQGAPGIKGLAGRLSLDENGGRFDVDGQNIVLTGADLRAPVALQLAGPLQWRYLDRGLQLTSAGLDFGNGDFKARLRGHVMLAKNASSPYLNLRLNYKDIELSRIHSYLPASRLHPKLLGWLERAFGKGRVPRGELRVQGLIDDFPFDDGQGVFEARFYVADASLNYAPRWPRVEGLRGEVLFRNRALRIAAVAGKIHGVDIHPVKAQIADLRQAVLIIQAQAQGAGERFSDFLRNGPLAKHMGAYAKDLRVTGVNTLDLDMRIPLRALAELQVQGAVGFAQGDLALPTWGVQLKEVEGVVEFTRSTLTAQGLDLLWQDQPVRMDISTHQGDHDRRETRFKVYGRIGVAAFGEHAARLQPYLDGKARWELLVRAPASGPLSLDMASDLRGLAVKLPGLLAKAGGETRSFNAHISLDQRQRRLSGWFDYGASLQATLEWAGFSPKPTFDVGEQGSARGEAQLPRRTGLKVTAHLPRFALPTAQAESNTAGAWRWPPWLQAAEVRVDELLLGQQRFPHVELRLNPRDDGIAIKVAGETVAGRVHIPVPVTPQTPIAIRLQHLMLNRDQAGLAEIVSQQSLRLAAIPPFWMSVRDLMLNAKPLGQLRLAVVPQEQGVRLTQFDLRSDVHRISATGNWLQPECGYGDRPLSRLQMELTSTNFGETLDAFGYENSLRAGEGRVNLAVHWRAPFPQATLAALDGHLQLHIVKGSLVELEPGLGRLVGLLNISSLARRLQLDFSDLFVQGLSFDLIKGHVQFRKGHAYTSVAIEAPSAQMHIAGRIGFQERDYHQTVTVVPQVSSPLAIAGTLAGGPAVGAAVFFAERLLKPEINQIARYQYSITGPWDDPVIQRVKLPSNLGISPEGYN